MASSLLNGDITLDANTSHESSGSGPSTAQAMEDDRKSPKRKPNSCKERGGVDRPERDVRRRKVESKLSWKTRLMKSFRRRSAPPLSEMEASDFAPYRQQPSPKLAGGASPLVDARIFKGSPLAYQVYIMPTTCFIELNSNGRKRSTSRVFGWVYREYVVHTLRPTM